MPMSLNGAWLTSGVLDSSTMKKLIVAMLAGALSARADWNLVQYREMRQSSDQDVRRDLREHVFELGEGMMFANVELAQDRGPAARLFCMPPDLPMNPDTFLSIVDAQLVREKSDLQSANLEKIWIGNVLMAGLRHTFACH
jgi:hypothetical protein